MKDTSHFPTYVKPLFGRLLIFASCYYKHPVSILIVQSFYTLIVNPASLPDIWKCCCRYLADFRKLFLNGYKFETFVFFLVLLQGPILSALGAKAISLSKPGADSLATPCSLISLTSTHDLQLSPQAPAPAKVRCQSFSSHTHPKLPSFT